MICPGCGLQHAGESDKMALLKNELDYQKQVRPRSTGTAAIEWSLAEIERLTADRERLRAALESISKHPDVPLLIRGVACNALEQYVT